MGDRIKGIKPCPFCGRMAKLRKRSKTIINGEQRYTCYVSCTGCDARGERFLLSENKDVKRRARENAIKAWNRRIEVEKDLRGDD